jgi:hypothetical protein
MAQFHSLPAQSLNALVNSGKVVLGDIYFANDVGITYLAMAGTGGDLGIAAIGNLILTGRYALEGAPGPQGETGATGPQGPSGSPGVTLAQVIALG